MTIGHRKFFRILGLSLLGICFGFGVLYIRGCIPGTLYFDASGLPHGTGWARYYYKSGAIKAEDYYVAGRARTSRYYRPDGSLITQTHWNNGSGTQIYLREDGSISSTMECVNELAHGKRIYYKEDGSIDHIDEYRNGKEVPAKAP